MDVNMDVSNGIEWELSKENVQPLKRGRKVANLSAALGSTSNDYQSKIHREKQAFEADIRTYEGDDPLEVWYRYFLWLCENFPTGGKDQITLLERCITMFKDEIKYKNDQRYLEIWMRYADMCSDPMDVYEYMHSQSVCSQLANFYKAWAYVLEELGNLKKADEVYKLGTAKNAQPLEVLQRHHRAFEMRLAENVTRDIVQNFDCENDSQRTALVDLKRHGRKGTVGAKRTGSATLSSKVEGLGYSKMSGNSKNAGFKVYCEDEVSGMSSRLPFAAGEWQVPPTKPITTKENTQKPGKWTESKLPQKHQRNIPVENVGIKPSFTVHVDNETVDHPPCTPQHGHVVMDKVLSSRKPEKDPTSELLRNIARENNEENKFKVMYCKDKIYAGAREFSFEQLRAARMLSRLAGRPWSSLYTAQESQNQNQFKVMYPKKEVYTFEEERPLDEVLLKRYFAHKEAKTKKVQATGAAAHQVHKNTMPMIKGGSDVCIKPIKTQEIKPKPKPDNAFQVFNDQENQREKSFPRGGLPLGISSSEGQSSLNPLTNNTHCMQSAFHPVIKDLQPRQALRDRLVPYEEPCGTTVSTNNHATVPQTSNIYNSLPNMEQKSTPTPVTPCSIGEFSGLGRLTPGSADICYSSPSVTLNTKAAQDVVLAMFNNPLGIDGNHDIPWMNRLQTNGSDKEFEAAFSNDNKMETMPAGLFGEPVTDITPFIKKEVNTQTQAAQENIIYDENQENRPPCDYFQQKSDRPIIGILQPSVGIPVCPLEQENNQDIGDGENDENQPPQCEKTTEVYDKQPRDVTEDANSFMATSNFKMAARMASTPFSQGLEPPSFVFSTIKPPRDQEVDFASVQGADEYTAKMFISTPNKILSPILEGSDEDTRWTASSSSSTISSGRGSASHQMPSTTSHLASIAEVETSNQSVTKQQSYLDSTMFRLKEDGTTDLNPFSDDVVEHLLQYVKPPVSSYDGYYTSQKDGVPKIAPNLAVNLGADDLYRVERCIGTGAFSKVFCAIKLNADLSCDDFDDEDEVTLKVQKTRNDWEFYVCRQLHTRIDNLQCGKTMHAFFLNPSNIYNYTNGSVLVNKYDRADTLLDVANNYKASGKTINEKVAILFAISLLRMLKTLHRCNIIHGDIKPDNILALHSDSCEDAMDLKLIDFGRSIDLQLFPSGTMFKVNCYTDGFQCIEMKTNKPWTTQVDTYGLLGTLYCLIHGEYMKEHQTEGRWRQNKSFKRHWNTQLWTKLFDTFLNNTNQNNVPSLTEQLLKEFENECCNMGYNDVQQARRQHDIIMNQCS